jgi:hypothetical protein
MPSTPIKHRCPMCLRVVEAKPEALPRCCGHFMLEEHMYREHTANYAAFRQRELSVMQPAEVEYIETEAKKNHEIH